MTGMPYRLAFLPSAARQLAKLPRDVQRRLVPKLEGLQTDPYPPGVTTIKGEDLTIYRPRVGDYRVLYRVKDQVLEVLVVEVGHRREVYRRHRGR
jgi:mRNA interferase RelE/StbE